ncbi:trna-specific trna nucleotidyltransferase [Moniliophthora roreri]|nr:trna-specific trna nucleotidyltransferase [Moniliophthora roreri]
MSSSAPLEVLLQRLQIPSKYAQNTEDGQINAQVIARLNAWKVNASGVLEELRDLLAHQNVGMHVSLTEKAKIVCAIAPFEDENENWSSQMSKRLATEILKEISEPDVPLLNEILSQHVKSMFRSNPHPSLNMSTGRKLGRPAGGPMASQDFYEGQTWKGNVGAPSIVLWCTDDYNRLWHLVIPPTMTILDDYQVLYKLKGTQIVLEILERVSGDLLKRTGIDGLILQSLNNCLGHFNHEHSPHLIRLAILASLKLILLTTSPGSATQFDQICMLLGEGVIGTIWLYSSAKHSVIEASIEVLPSLIRALGLGSSRYLKVKWRHRIIACVTTDIIVKALVPQLVHPLIPAPFKDLSVELQIKSLQALTVVLEICAPRIRQWKGTVLDGIARCWVTTVEKTLDMNESEREELRVQLRRACGALVQACPSVQEDEFKRLRDTDRMFGDLLL